MYFYPHLNLKRIFLSLIILFVLCFTENVSKAEHTPEMVLDADHVHYHHDQGLIIADGHVRLLYQNHLLLADKLFYYQSEDRVVAKGHVYLYRADGDLFVADEVDMTDQMKKGFVDMLRARLQGDLLIAAKRATRVDENHMILDDMVYSPCSVCRNSKFPPFWQIKAVRAERDDIKQEMSYEHAWFEVLGFPIFYTPILFHPTPGAKRKSGFLTPTFSHDTDFGSSYQIPYYWNIAPEMDATLRPTFYGNENPHLQGEFRHLTTLGSYKLSGSGIFPKSDNITADRHHFRGHVDSDGHFQFTDDWEGGFRLHRTTDNTYLRKYHLGSDPFLTSRVYAHHFDDQDYSMIDGLSFQRLDATQQADTPFILPWWRSHHQMSAPWFTGSQWGLKHDLLVLNRKTGSETRRVSLQSFWDIPWVTSVGHVWNFRPSLRLDGYHVYDVPHTLYPTDRDRDYSGKVGRFIPELEIDWKYPLVRRFHEATVMIEPLAKAQVSKDNNNSQLIPNEDCQNNELTDTNLFTSRRLYGLDRVEDGARASYGVHFEYLRDDNLGGSVLLGQHYRSINQRDLSFLTSYDHHYSDYVGRILLKPHQSTKLSYHFRIDPNSFDTKRDDIGLEFYQSPFTFSAHYLSLVDTRSSTQGKRKELSMNSALDVTKHWTFGLHGVKDLSNHLQRGTSIISGGGFARYNGDCVDVLLKFQRDFTQIGDVKPGSQIYVQLFLKTLN